MTRELERESGTLLLAGLDGGNLLAFFAALGTLRVLTESTRIPLRMSWSVAGGTWRPMLHAPGALEPAQLIDALDGALSPNRDQPEAHPCFQWKYWDGREDGRRPVFHQARESAQSWDRASCDWLSAIGSDVPARENEASDTPFRAARSDYLMGNLQTILTTTTASHLKRALMSPWTYDDPLDNCSLKLDPSEDRRHALQWSAPTKDRDRKKRGNMLGANRLALEAIPLFTSTSNGGRLATAACRRPRRGDWQITWSLWSDPISLDSARSILCLAEPLSDKPKPAIIQALGLCAVFRCRRETIGKTRVFTPARRVG